MIATGWPVHPVWVWTHTVFWILSSALLVMSAFGVWGLGLFRKRWRACALGGSLFALLLLLVSAQWSMWPMMVVAGLVVSLSLDARKPEGPAALGPWRRAWSGLLHLLAIALLVYGVTVIASRPWQLHWGATAEEIGRSMPGDERQPRFDQIDHVITVNAPPEKVWPWLIQLGQDKAGFYSYDSLERLIGMPVHNRYEIRPEWQKLKVGDYVRTYADRDAAMWRVSALEPNKLMVLDGWGPFWLSRLPSGGARLGIRTDPGTIDFVTAPIEVFIFEPVHFLMEEKMLRTMKELSER
ncbi:MAG TPA: hypothetical protein VK934_07700 [Fimbriimonas sp.]|nr:hypothetical protein [Fimbriimonas sp.]